MSVDLINYLLLEVLSFCDGGNNIYLNKMIVKNRRFKGG